jgi:hypothetical protein
MAIDDRLDSGMDLVKTLSIRTEGRFGSKEFEGPLESWARHGAEYLS